MMFLADSASSYTFSHATLTIVDRTYVEMDKATITRPIPEFNILVPTVTDIGPTNVMELYWPGEYARYQINHGKPNAVKYGFAMDFVDMILRKNVQNVGVYTVNLRGPSATVANKIVYLKYKVEANVPYTDENGNQYYMDEDHQLTTDPVPGGEITRDVLHVKVGSTYIQELKKWKQMMLTLDGMYSEEEDDEGYRTIPWFGVMYKGASSWANNTYFNLVPSVAEHDGCTYFSMNLFDGTSMHSSQPIYSFEQTAGEKYGLNYFIENSFNDAYPTMRWITSGEFDRITALFKKYSYTVDDFLNGKMDEASQPFNFVNPFDAHSFGIVTDEGSLNSQLVNAFQLEGGSDGSESRDELYRMFFDGEIVEDIIDPLRYRIPYIVDTGFDAETQQAVVRLCKKRLRTTNATLMIGGYDSLHSAVIDHQRNFLDDQPMIRQLAKFQCPMMFNDYARRNMIFPCTYFDTAGMLDHFAKNGNFYAPFAGAEARWTGFIEDTMEYPPCGDANYLQTLQKARINVAMRDAATGCYMSDQLMNTRLWSDQTELNNVFIISEMLYELLDLVHYNHFKFNEASHVRRFNNMVNERINDKFAAHSATLSCTVTRLGTTGREKYTNKLTVTIDLLDINRFTNIELVLVDE